MQTTKIPVFGLEDLELKRLVVERRRVILFVATTGGRAKSPCAVATLNRCTAATLAP